MATITSRIQVSGVRCQQPKSTRWMGIAHELDFPTWTIAADHVVTQSAAETYKSLFNKDPHVDKWTFSTNGVSIMGMFGIPCIGFGPGKEAEAHAPNEKTWKADLVRCAAFYATLPLTYLARVGLES